MKKSFIILILCVLSFTTIAQNRPYIDDKLFHFGFSLGLNFMDYGTVCSGDTIDGSVYQARSSYMTPGFSVGFITDLRLCRYLNLRFTPSLHFGIRTLTYKDAELPDFKVTTDVLCLPISIPLYLKWSAQREKNFRPYVIGGGGMQWDFGTFKEGKILQKPLDFFAEFGVGCDFYFEWFKLCPEITYSIGFTNQLTPVSARPELAKQDFFYTNALDRLRTHQITIRFNFE